jgi:hypothetical protein
MYGLVNKAIEQHVCTQFGSDAWAAIKRRAGIEDVTFLSMHSYPDDVTYRLVGAASAELNLPADVILRSFGTYWTMYTATEGYGELLKLTGGTLFEFLYNLDNMHARVGLSYPALQPPSFQCTDVTPTSLRLHYYSDRVGLAPMVVGLLEGLSKRFDSPITIDIVAHRDNGDDHEIFEIRLLGDSHASEGA